MQTKKRKEERTHEKNVESPRACTDACNAADHACSVQVSAAPAQEGTVAAQTVTYEDVTA